ncbi:AbiV family abortive infection protein [Sphingomonas faeni]|nr:AbiV family abortive infection protein [Sphingomonas faeni]
MSENLLRNRQHCLDHAQGFVTAAERIVATGFYHIVYHLSLLALEEVGKSSMIAGMIANAGRADDGWLTKAFGNHERKLQWAIWSPLTKIDPADFENARNFAERAHAMRLASLYVDPKAEIADIPARDVVTADDAANALALAKVRLELECARGSPDPLNCATDKDLNWFLDTMADADRAGQLLSKPFVDRYNEFDGNAREWIEWAREEFDRHEKESQALIQSELAKPAIPVGKSKPKWRASTTVYSSSHSLRPKVLQHWNKNIDVVQLIWTGKKNQFTVQVNLNDNLPLPTLAARAVSLAKLVTACLNIGSIGYFWFQQSGFERRMFDEVRDLENNRRIDFEPKCSFWDDSKAVALTDEHIDHATRCMMAFAPLSEEDAQSIFRPYYDGLALMAKSDIFYDFDTTARRAFTGSLAGAFAKYENWNGKDEDFRACYTKAFEPIIKAEEDRNQMFKVLTLEGDPNETSLANLRLAKQLADLYLITVSKRTWKTILGSGQAAQ